jgi:hypothetical protein
MKDEEVFKCDQPGCKFSSLYKAALGSHKLLKHGIAGTSSASLQRKKKPTDAKKRAYTRRKKEISSLEILTVLKVKRDQLSETIELIEQMEKHL